MTAIRWRKWLVQLRKFLWVADRQYLYAMPADRELAYVPAMPEGVSLARATAQDLEAVHDWPGPAWARKFRRFMRRGDIGFFLWNGDKLVAYAWTAARLKGRPFRYIQDPLKEGDVMLHRGHTHPEFRRRSLISCAVAGAMKYYLGRDGGKGTLKRFYSTVQVDSQAPQGLFTQLGFERTEDFWLIRLLGFLLIRWIRVVRPDGSLAPGKLDVRLKLPDVVWDWLPPATEY
jgi:hypothetical protein